MTEIRTQIFKIECLCDECKQGFMKLDEEPGLMMMNLIGGTKTFSHKCNNCGDIRELDKVYPYDKQEMYFPI